MFRYREFLYFVHFETLKVGQNRFSKKDPKFFRIQRNDIFPKKCYNENENVSNNEFPSRQK
jgi:hypothetical protein